MLTLAIVQRYEDALKMRFKSVIYYYYYYYYDTWSFFTHLAFILHALMIKYLS